MNSSAIKDFFKQADTYFWILPIAAGIWALLAAFIFYPSSVHAWQDKQAANNDAEVWFGRILEIEPQRLQYKADKGQSSEFDYSREINNFSQLFGITPNNYTLTTRSEIKRGGKRSKSADLTIKSANIETTAQFISALLARWSDLQCEQLTLEKLPSAKDAWKIKLRFTYYF